LVVEVSAEREVEESMSRAKLVAVALGTIAAALLAVVLLYRDDGSSPDGNTVVSVVAFEKLTFGSTYEEVANALGAKGEEREGSAGQTYEWQLSDGSRRKIVFIDGRMKYVSSPRLP
jgi:hypothetical protein